MGDSTKGFESKVSLAPDDRESHVNATLNLPHSGSDLFLKLTQAMDSRRIKVIFSEDPLAVGTFHIGCACDSKVRFSRQFASIRHRGCKCCISSWNFFTTFSTREGTANWQSFHFEKFAFKLGWRPLIFLICVFRIGSGFCFLILQGYCMIFHCSLEEIAGIFFFFEVRHGSKMGNWIRIFHVDIFVDWFFLLTLLDLSWVCRNFLQVYFLSRQGSFLFK